MRIEFYPECCFRLSLFPIIGEESNQLIEENGFDLDVFDSLDRINIDENGRNYDIFFDFYTSEDGIEYSVNNKTKKLKENALYIDTSKFDLEEAEEEPNDDFIFIDSLTKANVENEENIEIFNDIIARHNDATDEHVNIIFDAIRRCMRHVAERLVEDGLAEDVESLRFALQFGQVQGAVYSYEIDSVKFDPKLLRTIDCTDWNDCGNCETLFTYWPDRLLGCIIYDGKFYEGSCESIDSYDYDIDLVNCNMESWNILKKIEPRDV